MHKKENLTDQEQSKTAIEVPVLSEAIRRLGVPLSLVVAHDQMVYVSGIPPIDTATGAIVEGDIATQTEAALVAVNACLTAAGASLEHVISLKIYAANSGHYDVINQVYGRHFIPPYPARTFVPVGSWPRSFDLEIECIAARP